MQRALVTLFSLILLTWTVPNLHAQSNLEELAEMFYQNREYDKAVVYYQQLYDRDQSYLLYEPYHTCLLAIKDYKLAEKLIRRQQKLTPDKTVLHVDLGEVYTLLGDPKKSRSQFEDALDEIKGDANQAIQVAQAFTTLKEYDWAIQVYERAAKFNKDYPFNIDLAEVYLQKGDRVAMLREYLNLLEVSESYLPQVQNALQGSVSYSNDPELTNGLRTELLKKVQQFPERTVYSELLIWQLIQQKEFDAAFTQAKGIDKRKREDGSRLMNLGQLALANAQYESAQKIFQYVIDKGPEGYYYAQARIELVSAAYQKVIGNPLTGIATYREVERMLQQAILDLGESAQTLPLIMKRANLLAYYLKDANQALTMLEKATNLPQLNPKAQAECKLAMADVLLFNGLIWDAALVYGQVEKAFKYEPIGQEAKFRNARLAYFNGDFKWAQAQLDVLKGSTSKLIANDAMELSLLISDNMVMDTNAAPMRRLAQVDLWLYQFQDSIALVLLDSLQQNYPSHEMKNDVMFRKAKTLLKLKRYQQALTQFDALRQLNKEDIYADDALFLSAELYEGPLADATKAKEMYEQLITDYPGSLYVVEARKRFRKLRGDLVTP